MIGVEDLPESIRRSSVLSSKELELLSSVNELPFVDPTFEDNQLKNIIQYYSVDPDEMENELHLYAKELLSQEKVYEAWQVLLTNI